MTRLHTCLRCGTVTQTAAEHTDELCQLYRGAAPLLGRRDGLFLGIATAVVLVALALIRVYA